MRKLILGFYVSLDGKSADGDNGIRDVMMAIDDPEQEEYFVNRLWEAGAFLMGRNTYQAMAGVLAHLRPPVRQGHERDSQGRVLPHPHSRRRMAGDPDRRR